MAGPARLNANLELVLLGIYLISLKVQGWGGGNGEKR